MNAILVDDGDFQDTETCMMKMLTINIDGWPDRVVKVIEHFVQSLNHQLGNKSPTEPAPELPLWPGVSLPPEKLRRVEIYRDAH